MLAQCMRFGPRTRACFSSPDQSYHMQETKSWPLSRKMTSPRSLKKSKDPKVHSQATLTSDWSKIDQFQSQSKKGKIIIAGRNPAFSKRFLVFAFLNSSTQLISLLLEIMG
jgi:hypothetical protein